MSRHLLIIGAGTLGSALIKNLADRVFTSITAETKSTSRHTQLLSLGCQVRCREEPCQTSFSDIVFAVPPTGFTLEEYEFELQRASQLYAPGQGVFMMVSSTGVYPADACGLICEQSPVDRSERTAKLLAAERIALSAGGRVLRLAGLYNATRGPHMYYLRHLIAVSEDLDRPVNLIHDNDAARLITTCLTSKKTLAPIIHGSDGHAVWKSDIIAAALNSRLIAKDLKDRYLQAHTPLTHAHHKSQRSMQRQISNKLALDLGWSPKYESFLAWANSSTDLSFS